jgi:hypothetical protein
VDLLANLAVPRIAAPQFALVEPDFDARCPECFADTARRISILRGVAQEHRLARVGHGAPVAVTPLRFSGSTRSAIQRLFIISLVAYRKPLATASRRLFQGRQ